MAQSLKIIPLGGLGTIGKNMMAIQYEDDILVIDAGVLFPGEDLPGVDLIIPDTTFLKDNRDKVRAILITHGHEDHIGAIPYLLKDFNVPVYAPKLAKGLMELKIRPRKILKERTIESIEPENKIKIGKFSVHWFRVCHSIPDAMGIVIETPLGNVVHTGDFKIDHTPVDSNPTDLGVLSKLGEQGVLLLLSDSTYAEVPGYTPSEKIVGETLEKVIGDSHGRVIIATFASLIARIQQILDAAVKYKRKVSFVGKSMKDNVKLGLREGYLQAPNGLIVSTEEIRHVGPSEAVIVTTGSQGEPTSALTRIAKNEHKELTIIEGDTVVISATPIPGNETVVSKNINNLLKLGAKVLHDKIALVHVHGHASQEELKMVLNVTKPKYFVPIHGEYRHLKAHADIACSLGMETKNTFVLEDGDVLSIDGKQAMISDKVKAGPVYVNGPQAWTIEGKLIEDRKSLAREGILFIVATIDSRASVILREPEIFSEGVITTEMALLLDNDIQTVVKESLYGQIEANLDSTNLENMIRDEVSALLVHRTGRKPIITPVIIDVGG